ncbi:MAG: UDP-N-acetylmuramoyl-tripeptide--D-alanyl-D-alanine ligase [Bdellovibrionales bacterium]|nr:UDP-N-acetylmuramoyl-tripeptide--D-alanyl-D-alanine ligase [Bdellovibrionales bacterium]
MTDKFSLDFVSQATHGTIKTSGSTHFNRVETDSRKDLSGSLFIALKGDQFDGHHFIEKAIEAGAAGVLTHQWSEKLKAYEGRVSIILVKDTLLALQGLSHQWRVSNPFKVVGITGSNGKTTTKEMAYQILKKEFKVSASPGSFNNHWGVPLSLLQADADDDVVLQEMGMNHKGEITKLCQLARPDVSVVTMIGSAHIGELGSIEAIRDAKNEIYVNSPEALHIYNLDNEFTLDLYTKALKNGFPKNRTLTFSSFNQEADIYLRSGSFMAEGLEVSGFIRGEPVQFQLKAFGRQAVVNLLAASAIGLALGLSPKKLIEALSSLEFQSWGRNQRLKLKSGSSIIFDGYNANPESTRMLLKNLYELESPGEKIFIMGDMLELGDFSESAHREIAEFAGQVGLSKIWYFGSHQKSVKEGLVKSGFSGKSYFSKDFDEVLSKELLSGLGPEDVVALKASRGSRVERVLHSWGVDGF